MGRSALVAAALAVLVLAAGCGAFTGTASPTTTTTPTTASSTTAGTPARTTAPGTTPAGPTTRQSPPKGTQIVSLVRLENQRSHTQWPDEQTVHIRNLSDRRRAVFRAAFPPGNESVRFGPDERNPFSYHDDDRPRAVRYDGTWYYVRVAIV
ncbi:MAG: hypothetical protein ABEJ08_02585 [Halobacteriaceae archaeon]